MKEKIFIFIIGILTGAIIATGTIYFYTLAIDYDEKNNQSNIQAPENNGGPNGQQPNGGTPPDMPNNNTNTD